MRNTIRKGRTLAIATIALAGLFAAGSLAVATAAAGSDSVLHYRDTAGPFTNAWGSCGAIETVTVTVHGTVFFDANGDWVRTIEHAAYDSVVTGPTGRSISLDAHQNAEFTAAGINTLSGQSANVRAPGLGLLYQDVGRIVFDVTVPFPGETLFVSAKAVSFDAFDEDKLGAAICAAVG
jgi:hypothetical protein